MNIPALTTTPRFNMTPAPAAADNARLHSEPVHRVTPAVSGGGEVPGGDRVTISARGREKARQAADAAPTGAADTDTAKAAPPASGPEDLDMAELRMVERLKMRDREVKAHEMAHLANAGQYAAGGPSYTYQQGPDGRRYAVGGEVPIDISGERTPEETIRKMRTVRRAAMAPANPSSADRNIAAMASRKEAEARQELAREQEGDREPGTPEATADAGPAPVDETSSRDDGAAPFGRTGLRP